MSARDWVMGAALGLGLLGVGGVQAADAPDCCKDFSFSETREIGAWAIISGAHSGSGETEHAAFNTAQGLPNAGFVFSCGGGPVAYALMDGEAHAAGQSYKVTFTIDKTPPQTLDGQTTGEFGVISVTAGTHLIEAISNANSFKIKAVGHGKSRELTFANDNGRTALLTWGRLCGIHD